MIREEIRRDIVYTHPDAYSVDIVREEHGNDTLKVIVEVRTSTTYLVYEYTVDKNVMKISSKNLLYIVPML